MEIFTLVVANASALIRAIDEIYPPLPVLIPTPLCVKTFYLPLYPPINTEIKRNKTDVFTKIFYQNKHIFSGHCQQLQLQTKIAQTLQPLYLKVRHRVYRTHQTRQETFWIEIRMFYILKI